MAIKIKYLLACGVAFVAMPAIAAAEQPLAIDTAPVGPPQDVAAPQASVESSDAATDDVITVTGSRLRLNGNDLPTPVTVLGTEQLQNTTPNSLPDALNKMPAFNSTQSVNQPALGNGRGNRAPGNFLDLRGLGSIRNLILQDGKRVLGTFFDGTVDTDMLPQILIQRVEVVTGGASAVYGSDAISGVVNFITDNKFNGIKGTVQGGLSEYGDSESYRIGIAGGFDVGSNGHLIFSAETFDRAAIEDMGTRPYGDLSAGLVGSGTVASPYYTETNLRYNNMTWGGRPLSGPLLGRHFADDGSLIPYDPGTLTPTSNITVGGDGSKQHNQALTPSVNTKQIFGRYDHDFGGDIHGYVSGRWARKQTYAANSHISNTLTNFPISIYSGNAFLRPEIQDELDATNTTQFFLGRDDEEFTGPGPKENIIALTTTTKAYAFNAGLDGQAWGDFAWDVYYSHSNSRTKLNTNNNVNAMRFYAATDAVKDTSGNIVCRVTITAPEAYPGCKPMNLFGMFNISQDAIDYVTEDTSWTATTTMDDFGANLAGTLFEGWAGPVSVAFGGEYRKQDLEVETSVSDPSFHPEFLRAGANGSTFAASNLAYIKEVQSAANGKSDVAEGNVEINVPLLRDLPLIESLSFNGGYRYTHYWVSGNGTKADFSANTWKLGLEWQVFSDLRFRATRSRDIRAPTLWDLYQLQTRSSGGYTDALTDQAGSVNTVTGGNPNLVPEVGDSTTIGGVYTPGWAPGLSLSVDYFKVKLDNAVGAVNGGSSPVQALCLASDGSSPYCDLIERPISYNDTSNSPNLGNFPTLIYSLNQNIAFRSVEGVDVEANYTTNLGDWSGLEGTLGIRALYTWQPGNKSQSLPGATITNVAGTPTQPEHKATLALDYRLNGAGVSILERFVSASRLGDDPTRVYLDPYIGSYFQTDVNFSYDFQKFPVTAFLNISNLFNAKGDVVPGSASVPGQAYPSAPYADIIGRYFTLGARFKF